MRPESERMLAARLIPPVVPEVKITSSLDAALRYFATVLRAFSNASVEARASWWVPRWMFELIDS